MTEFLKRVSGEWVLRGPRGRFLVGGWVPRWGVWRTLLKYLDPVTKVMRTGWLFERGSWYLSELQKQHAHWMDRTAAPGTPPGLNWDTHRMVQPGHLGTIWGSDR